MPKYRSTRSEKKFLELLRRKFKAPAYAVLAQVSIPVMDEGSKPRRRTIDALALASWPSRDDAGIRGFELKADRGSWLSELKNPKKAEDWAKFCDEWYLVACQDVAQKEEIPPNWGFYEEKHGGLVLIKPAVRLTPQEPSRELFFSIFQAIMHQLHPEATEKALDQRYAEGLRDGEATARRYFSQALSEIKGPPPEPSPFAELERILSTGPWKDRPERVRLFEEMAKLFTKWHSLGPTEAALKAVEFLSRGGLRSVAVKLGYIKDQISQMSATIEEQEKAIIQAANDAQPEDLKPSADEVSA